MVVSMEKVWYMEDFFEVFECCLHMLMHIMLNIFYNITCWGRDICGWRDPMGAIKVSARSYLIEKIVKKMTNDVTHLFYVYYKRGHAKYLIVSRDIAKSGAIFLFKILSCLLFYQYGNLLFS